MYGTSNSLQTFGIGIFLLISWLNTSSVTTTRPVDYRMSDKPRIGLVLACKFIFGTHIELLMCYRPPDKLLILIRCVIVSSGLPLCEAIVCPISEECVLNMNFILDFI